MEDKPFLPNLALLNPTCKKKIEGSDLGIMTRFYMGNSLKLSNTSVSGLWETHCQQVPEFSPLL